MTLTNPIRGRVWKFGDNVSTTDISPGEMFSSGPHKPKDIVFAALRPEWKDMVQPGDCIVAGKNFGFGSHRASANDAMKDLGLGCIVADSIARIFYRSAIQSGFPVISCPEVSALFQEGDELELDILTGDVRNLTTGLSAKAQPYPPELLEILENGGLEPLLLARFA